MNKKNNYDYFSRMNAKCRDQLEAENNSIPEDLYLYFKNFDELCSNDCYRSSKHMKIIIEACFSDFKIGCFIEGKAEETLWYSVWSNHLPESFNWRNTELWRMLDPIISRNVFYEIQCRYLF